tara:strand:+ start:193 stop:828 length:636 start_codon:yes stop_codon:yes gene_type:complete
MHTNEEKINVICLGTDNLNNSLIELKQYFKFKIIFSKNHKNDILQKDYSTILIDNDVLNNSSLIESLNKINKSKLLILNSLPNDKCIINGTIQRPFNINEINKKIIELNSKKKFSENSFIKIKDYILNKNEKKLIKNSDYVVVTEKEIQLLELLQNEKESVSKKMIQKKVWNYSSDADTHTVETHIYRLRKKISEKFNDNIILNTKEGYKI